jgi:hypothetical protein
LTELKQIIALSHPNKTRAEIVQIYLQKVISILPSTERQSLIADVDQREELIKQGLVEKPYESHELDKRILFHCRHLNPFNSRVKEVYQLRGQNHQQNYDRDEFKEQNEPLSECLALLKDIKNDISRSTKNLKDQKIEHIVLTDRSQCILYYPEDDDYDDVISQIKREDGIKYFGQSSF